MPQGFTAFTQGCPGLAALGFTFDDSGCDIEGAGYALYKECGFTCPLGQFAQILYDGGTQNAGPAIRISSTSKKNAFKGLVALYIPAQHKVKFVLYKGESLLNIATVLSTRNVTLNVNDVLRIESDAVLETTYSVSVNGTIIMTSIVDATLLNPFNPCVGFVVVLNV